MANQFNSGDVWAVSKITQILGFALDSSTDSEFFWGYPGMPDDDKGVQIAVIYQVGKGKTPPMLWINANLPETIYLALYGYGTIHECTIEEIL